MSSSRSAAGSPARSSAGGLGARLLMPVEETLGPRLRLADLFDAPTPAGLAETVRRSR